MQQRTADRRAVSRLVAQGGAITLTGPPGVGKSHLARAVLAQFRRDGWRCALCDLSEAEPDSLSIAISAAMHWTDPDDLENDLLALPQHGRTVVLLDNADHLTEALARWVEPYLDLDLSWIVTSRHAMGLASEQIYRVGPLAQGDAVGLLDREIQRLGGRPLDEEARAEAIPLVESLDGLPLAISLVAPHCRLRGVAGARKRLADGRLPSSARASAHRHGSLDDALDLSLAMLSDSARTVLSQLTVFRGRFSLDAVEAVVDAAQDVSDLVYQLVAHSLVELEETNRGPRLRLLSLIRQLAERLLPDEGRDRAAARHADFYLDLEGDDEELRGHLPNLLAAVDRVDSDPARLAEVVQRCIRAIRASGPSRLGYDLVERALEAQPGQEHEVSLLLIRGGWCRLVGDLARARQDVGRALQLADQVNDQRSRSRALYHLGVISQQGGDLDDAAQHLNEAERALDGTGYTREMALLAILRGNASWRAFDFQGARGYFRRAVGLADSVSDPVSRGVARNNLASTCIEVDQLNEAAIHLEDSSQVHQANDYATGLGFVMNNRGKLALARGELDDAVRWCSKALAAHRGLSRPGQVDALLYRAIALTIIGDTHAALTALNEGERRNEPTVLPTASFVLWRAAVWSEAASPQMAREVFASAGQSQHKSLRQLIGALLGLGDPDAGSRDARLSTAAATLREVEPVGLEERLAHRLLEARRDRVAASTPVGASQLTWEVAVDGEWFRPSGGERVDLGRRPALARLLGRLVRELRVHPGGVVPTHEMVEAGWPGEAMSPDSGTARVYTTIRRMRKLGLGELLEGGAGGYRLNPNAPLELI